MHGIASSCNSNFTFTLILNVKQIHDSLRSVFVFVFLGHDDMIFVFTRS